VDRTKTFPSGAAAIAAMLAVASGLAAPTLAQSAAPDQAASKPVPIIRKRPQPPAPEPQRDDPPPPLPAIAAEAPSAQSPAVATAAEGGGLTGPARYGLVLPAEHRTDLLPHWAARRDYLRDRDERRAEDEEQRVRDLKKELAIDNLFVIGAALVRESHEALAAGSPALARKRCALAVELAPALPDAHFCLARAMLAEDGTALKAALGEVAAGAQAARGDPRVRRAQLANAATVLLVGLLLAGLVFVGLLVLRYGQLYKHDLRHLLPAGARPWQTALLALVILLAPLLFHLGPVPLLVTALAACALYASRVEVAAACGVLLVVAATPFLAAGISRVAAFGGPAADVYLIERGEGSPASLARLQRRLETGAAAPSDGAKPSDFAVAFALARKAKREGDLGSAQALYARALETPGASAESLAAARNNLGNVLLLSGDGAKAAAQYQQAIDLQETLAAAHFNLSRALNLGTSDQLPKVQGEQQRALDLDRPGIERFTEGSLQVNRKSNKFVMDVPLPESSLPPLEAADAALASAVGDEAGAALSGPLPSSLALVWPLLAAAALLGLHFSGARLKPSGRCERCGREVCRRCDADARPAEGLCAQCVNVFVRRANVDPVERVRKELAVQFYHRRRTVLLRLMGVISGAGHVLMGHPLRGLLYLVLTGSLLASVIFFHGIAHAPIAVRSGVSLLRVGTTAAVLVAVYALCLRDLLARQRAEDG
jgi:hypothetical protein